MANCRIERYDDSHERRKRASEYPNDQQNPSDDFHLGKLRELVNSLSNHMIIIGQEIAEKHLAYLINVEHASLVLHVPVQVWPKMNGKRMVSIRSSRSSAEYRAFAELYCQSNIAVFKEYQGISALLSFETTVLLDMGIE
jgi:hypothetical protein